VEAAACWLTARRDRSGKRAGMSALTDLKCGHGVTLLTRDKLHFRPASRDILTAEAARALTLVERTSRGVQDAGQCVDHANRWLSGPCLARDCRVGSVRIVEPSYVRETHDHRGSRF
jgi:hypothetical protein